MIDGLTEDIHTNEICMRYLIPALANMGARVISCRERGEVVHEALGDNGQGAPRYTETGSWTHLGSGGHGGGSYRVAFSTTGQPTATATWSLPLPADGIYPVYVFFRAGSFTNTVQDSRFTIHHSGGGAPVRIDQTQDDRRWVHLGNYSFARKTGARIVLDNQSATVGKLVIADAVRVGGGRGSISRGGRTSGKPRWQECSRYWTQFAGAPASVYNPVATGQDNSDDVTARPRYAEWRGADAYVSLHTNAGGGSGTSSYIYNGGATKGSAALQSAVQAQLVKDIRAEYDSAWVDRGRRSANFGEVRLLKTMPGLLVELAFHDTKNSKDHRALHDPRFRYIAGRAYARGILRYFNSTVVFPPEPPAAMRVVQDGSRGLQVVFEPAFGATSYAVEQSPDGKGFVKVAQTTSTSWSTGPLPHGTLMSFRVRALNKGGRSFPTEVLTAGTSHTARANLLLVQGFDRRDRWVKHPENTRDYLRLHGAAIRAGGEFSLGFDAASNEAVMAGRIKLAAYRAVDWACGEESTQHETFSTVEQGLVRTYLQQGGRLLVSGAEIGWDLDHKGSTSDRNFYRSVLGARYVRDDANTYSFTATSGGIFNALSQGRFDDGTSGTYDVDYADVIAPADSKSTLCLSYAGGTGGGAAIQRIDGNSRLVNLGFPLETITDPALRTAVMTRALRFLLTPRQLEAGPEVLLGKTLP
ncbi:MAG: golvesin C-terminal-like domain-containing protein, partial [Planctomycetota bacterium]